MKRKWKDIQQDILLFFLKPFVHIWMFFDAKRKINIKDGFSFWRRKPYIMLANHTFLFDVVHVPLRIHKAPFIVASQTLFTMQPTKFLLSQIAHVVPKSKGASDLRTARGLIGAVRRGYPILIFPEGDTTFYGETNYIEESTMKLIKKLKVDVVTCTVRGGYLSKPRWATGKRKNRRIELNYQIPITAEELKNMSVQEISQTINDVLYNNDYDYQREQMIPHPGKNLAEGIENVVYICPECEAVNSIKSKGNKFYCTSCDKEGYLDKYGFLHGFRFDNLIEWDEYQRTYKEKLLQSNIKSSGRLFFMDLESGVQRKIGEIDIEYNDNLFRLTGAHNEDIPLAKVSNPTITLRRDLGFIYDDKFYIIKLDKYGASLLRIAQDKY